MVSGGADPVVPCLEKRRSGRVVRHAHGETEAVAQCGLDLGFPGEETAVVAAFAVL